MKWQLGSKGPLRLWQLEIWGRHLKAAVSGGGTLTESYTYWSKTRTPKQLAPLRRGWKWRSWGSRTQSYRRLGKREAQPHPDWKEQQLQALSEGTAPIMRWEESQSVGSDLTSLRGPALSGLVLCRIPFPSLPHQKGKPSLPIPTPPFSHSRFPGQFKSPGPPSTTLLRVIAWAPGCYIVVGPFVKGMRPSQNYLKLLTILCWNLICQCLFR